MWDKQKINYIASSYVYECKKCKKENRLIECIELGKMLNICKKITVSYRGSKVQSV